MVLAFDDSGMLTPGDHELTFDELRGSILIDGPLNPPVRWDVSWRGRLVDKLEILVGQLWLVGVDEVAIGGSFAEDAPRPNDIDGYFKCDPRQYYQGVLQEQLNRIDPYAVWRWDKSDLRRDSRGGLQTPMWHRYRVDLWPDIGQPTGEIDKFGNDVSFAARLRSKSRWIASGDHQNRQAFRSPRRCTHSIIAILTTVTCAWRACEGRRDDRESSPSRGTTYPS